MRLTLDYDYMCSETDFTREKSHFHPNTKITVAPNCFLLFCQKMVIEFVNAHQRNVDAALLNAV